MRRLSLGVSVLAALSVVVTTRADVGVSANVPEAANFQLVYSLDIPAAANYSAAPVPYSVDNHLTITGPVDRIAYYLELMSPGGQPQFVFASMDAFTQIHNHDERQTLFAYNRWNDGVNASDLGIGNNTQTTFDNRVNADWTFRGNAGGYSAKTLQILVRLGQPTRAAILPLGDSITDGAGAAGGYRGKLFNSLTLAGRTVEFIGSAGGNPSAALTTASQVSHETATFSTRWFRNTRTWAGTSASWISTGTS